MGTEETMNALVAAGLTESDVVAVSDVFDGPSGYDSVDNDCITIPFLKIAQSGTEETKKGSSKRIEGLEAGMFFCPATRKVYGESVNLIILRFYRQYIVYDSKETNAKFLGPMSPEHFRSVIEPYATRERSYHLDSEGHRYVDTRNFIVLVAGHYEDGPMLLSLSSTGISPSKKWLTQAQNVRAQDGRVAPIWANVWNVAAGYFDNDAGSYYQISKVDRLGFVGPKYKEFVVKQFLDAQAAASDVLDNSYERDANADKPAEDASHTDVPVGVQAESKAGKQGPARQATGEEQDIF